MRIRLLMREMRRLKLAHRCRWIGRDGAGSPAEVLKFGRGTDAPRPRIPDRQGAPEGTGSASARSRSLPALREPLPAKGALPKFGVQQFHLIGAGAAG